MGVTLINNQVVQQQRIQQQRNDDDDDRRHLHETSSSSASDNDNDNNNNESNSMRKIKNEAKRERNRRRNRRRKGKRKSIAAAMPQDVSRYVAIDCEMVGYGYRGFQSMLARVTIVDWNSHILLDTYVKPTHTVTDYRTHVSGITIDHLTHKNKAQHFDWVRTHVLQLIKDKVVIGHALHNDLDALQIQHHWYLLRDTSHYPAFMQILQFHHHHHHHHHHPSTNTNCQKNSQNQRLLWGPRKLKHLVKEYLHRDIQPYGKPHSAFEDSVAAFDLYKLVREQWEKKHLMTYKIQ